MNRHQRRKESKRLGTCANKALDAPEMRQFENAVSLMKAGRWQDAEVAQRSVLKTSPRHTPSLHHLGLIAFKLGLVDEALSSLRQALDVDPRYHEARLNLAVILKMQGARREALEHCRQVAIAEPQNPSAHFEIATILKDMGDNAGAISAYRRALELNRSLHVAEWSLAQCLASAGEPEACIELCRKILKRDATHKLALKLLVRTLSGQGKPQDVHCVIDTYDCTHAGRQALLNDAAIGLAGSGRPLQAADLLRDAIARDPNAVDLLLQLGSVLKDLGRQAEAFDVLKKALDRDPSRAEGYVTLGYVLQAQGAIDGALTALRHAVSLKPELMAARMALGAVLLDANQLECALEVFKEALKRDPQRLDLLLAIASVKRMMCDWDGLDRDEAACISELRASSAVISPFQLLGMPVRNEDMRVAGTNYTNNISKLAKTESVHQPYRTFVAKGDRIRVGYLSSDFCNHATSLLLAEVIELHDRNRFEVFGYCHSLEDGSMLRRRIASAFDIFQIVRDKGNHEVAEQIRNDGIEILIDLKGFTRGARQEILALRPAPVQVNYLGYPATSGASYIDYILADAVVAPLEHQEHYSEKIVHLGACYQPNDRRRPIHSDAVTRAACDLPEDAFVFCSFNNNFKLNRTFFSIWMDLLKAVPSSVLWLLPKSQIVRDNLSKEAAAHGVSPSRLIFASSLPNDQHLARHAVADLFLDSLPCSAHTTASDALWAGLPLLTCLGPTFAGRVAASALLAANLPELVTSSLDDYASTALRLAQDRSELSAIKAKIISGRTTASLFDTPKYVKSLESALSKISQIYRADEAPRSLSATDLM